MNEIGDEPLLLDGRDYRHWRNRWLFLRRMIPWGRWPQAVTLAFASALTEAAVRLFQESEESAWTPLRATRDGILDWIVR